MALSAAIQITDQDVYTVSASFGAELLGQMAATSDGRGFVYSKNGATQLTNGLLTQAAPSVANSVSQQAGSTIPAGTTTISYTLGATAVTQDQYRDGYFVVTSGTGAGQSYLILGNTAASSTNSYAITVKLASPLVVGLISTSTVSLMPNLNSANVVLAHTAAPAIPATGVPNVIVPVSNFYWSQVSGYTSLLSDGAITKNAQGIPSNGVDGAVEIRVDATIINPVGFAPELTVDTQYSPFVLTLA